jgi:hypothetical protein
MALGPINRDYPDRWLGCRPPGRQKEKEGPRLRKAAVYRAGRRNCDRGLGVKTGGYGRIVAHTVSYPNVFQTDSGSDTDS